MEDMEDMSEIAFGERTPEEQREILYDKLSNVERKLARMESMMARINWNMVKGFTSMTLPSIEQMEKDHGAWKKKQSEEYRQQIFDVYSSQEYKFCPECPSEYDRIIVIRHYYYDGRIMVDRLTGNYAVKCPSEDKDKFLENANKYLSEHPDLFVTRMEWPLKVYSAPGVDRESLLKVPMEKKEEKE